MPGDAPRVCDRPRRRRGGRAARRCRIRRRRVEHARKRRQGGRRPRPADPGGARLREHAAARRVRASAGRARDRRPAARALEGQGHDDGPLGADGCRHAAGDADVPVRLPRRRDRSVHEPHRPRRALQQARERHRGDPGVRRGAPEDGEMDRLHERRLGLPDRRARGDGAAGGAVRRLPRRARDPDGQARRRARDRSSVQRRARARTSARRTVTTSRSSLAARTTSRSSATPVTRSTASARSATSSRIRTSTRSSRRSRTSRESRRPPS